MAFRSSERPFLCIPTHTAVQINIMLSVFLAIFMIRNIRDEIN